MHAEYRFFPILVVFTVTFVCVLGRDFGPMLSAERSSKGATLVEKSTEGEEMHEIDGTVNVYNCMIVFLRDNRHLRFSCFTEIRPPTSKERYSS